jgi:hypothetical protein
VSIKKSVTMEIFAEENSNRKDLVEESLTQHRYDKSREAIENRDKRNF